jgi:hypothetical protein
MTCPAGSIQVGLSTCVSVNFFSGRGLAHSIEYLSNEFNRFSCVLWIFLCIVFHVGTYVQYVQCTMSVLLAREAIVAQYCVI